MNIHTYTIRIADLIGLNKVESWTECVCKHYAPNCNVASKTGSAVMYFLSISLFHAGILDGVIQL